MLGSGCESSSLTQCTGLLIFFAVSVSNVKPDLEWLYKEIVNTTKSISV